ncbi:MAG: universal stress protein [Bacteroidales bacterium]|nr:universal stress protein [Bacteroidales bacterium]
MKKTKKVLIALDYDTSAQKVANLGFEIANSMQAEITLMHVLADVNYYSSTAFSPIIGFMGFNETDIASFAKEDGLKDATTNYLSKVKQKLGDEKIKIVIREGDFSNEILEEAQKLHADFIVMGSHSRSWLNDILMGSVVEKVFKNTNIPLMIVPIKKEK